MDNTKQYDEIVNTLIQNVLAERRRCSGIALWGFNPDDGAHRLYFNAATIIADFYKEPIYLDMDFFPYLILKIKMRKRRNLRYARWSAAYKELLEKAASTDILINFVCQHFEVDRSFLEKINNEYYGWV